MPEADAGRDAKRQMGKSTPTNERERTRNKVTERKYPQQPKKEIAIYTKAPDREKERGQKEKDEVTKRLMREKRQDAEIGHGNEENTKHQTKQQPTKQQATYEIALTLPTTEKRNNARTDSSKGETR